MDNRNDSNNNNNKNPLLTELYSYEQSAKIQIEAVIHYPSQINAAGAMEIDSELESITGPVGINSGPVDEERLHKFLLDGEAIIRKVQKNLKMLSASDPSLKEKLPNLQKLELLIHFGREILDRETRGKQLMEQLEGAYSNQDLDNPILFTALQNYVNDTSDFLEEFERNYKDSTYAIILIAKLAYRLQNWVNSISVEIRTNGTPGSSFESKAALKKIKAREAMEDIINRLSLTIPQQREQKKSFLERFKNNSSSPSSESLIIKDIENIKMDKSLFDNDKLKKIWDLLQEKHKLDFKNNLPFKTQINVLLAKYEDAIAPDNKPGEQEITKKLDQSSSAHSPTRK
ncbi:MAG: hypothetical protein H0W64_10290 [Gammaproteobacteria bacterium]|nr:hypothetical protein [Gammaproteobacteria bacterium]